MTLQDLAVLSPLVVLIGAVVWLNWTSFRAALAALALLAVVTAGIELTTALPNGLTLAELWWSGFAEAVILAGMVVLTLFFGLLLHRLMEASGRLDTLLSVVRVLGRSPTERLFWVLVVIGPLFESISGFGLGVVIVVPMLMALGYAPLQVMALSLLTQLAVPWGALAIGMGLGAGMTGLTLGALGPATALLAAPGYAIFWAAALLLGVPTWNARLRALPASLATLLVFATAVWAANRYVSPELGGVIGPLAAALWLHLTGAGLQRQNGQALPGSRAVARALLPYGVLVALLFVTRYHAPLAEWLNTHGVVRLPGSAFALPLLYNPGLPLALACLTALWGFSGSGFLEAGQPGRNLPGLLGETVGQWLRAALAVFALILVARALQGAGLVGILSSGLTMGEGSGAEGAVVEEPGGWSGWLLPFAISFLAALGGFLTGSVAGANALFINVQTSLAAQGGLSLLWTAAVQNMVAAASTAFSPARVVFAATMTGRHGEEGKVLRTLLPLAAAVLMLGALLLLPGVEGILEAIEPWVIGGAG